MGGENRGQHAWRVEHHLRKLLHIYRSIYILTSTTYIQISVECIGNTSYNIEGFIQCDWQNSYSTTPRRHKRTQHNQRRHTLLCFFPYSMVIS